MCWADADIKVGVFPQVSMSDSLDESDAVLTTRHAIKVVIPMLWEAFLGCPSQLAAGHANQNPLPQSPLPLDSLSLYKLCQDQLCPPPPPPPRSISFSVAPARYVAYVCRSFPVDCRSHSQRPDRRNRCSSVPQSRHLVFLSPMRSVIRGQLAWPLSPLQRAHICNEGHTSVVHLPRGGQHITSIHLLSSWRPSVPPPSPPPPSPSLLPVDVFVP